jgi:hypothetical protein
MNNYLGDELANKVKILSLALSDADKIIEILQEENKTLKDILSGLMSINKENHADAHEAICV